jgi:predicted small lipoprotein YifL
MRIASNVLFASVLALVTVAGCGKKLPGAVPGSDKMNAVSDKVPGAGGDSMLDPNACGGYASSDAGRKLKAFLQATQDLEKATTETAAVVKNSCMMIGNEIGMTDADYKGETKDICAAVYGRVAENMKVAFKSKAGLKVKFKPAVCSVDVSGSVQAAASCEAKGSADIKASCSGSCNGKCEGTCSAKNAKGECAGECKGTCSGKCDGYAEVDASAQCKANAEVKASVDVQCTKPDLTIEADAKLVVDKAKAEATIKGLKAGLPEIFSVKARLVPMKHAVETWAKSAAELKDSAISLANNFKDQAKCVTGQVYAAAKMTAAIQANVSVSVEVSASASGSIGQ